MNIDAIRALLKEFGNKIIAAGGTVQYSNYGLGMTATNRAGQTVVISKAFREEVDGYRGMKVISESLLDRWLKGADRHEISGLLNDPMSLCEEIERKEWPARTGYQTVKPIPGKRFQPRERQNPCSLLKHVVNTLEDKAGRAQSA
jgi:hypothetical protein